MFIQFRRRNYVTFTKVLSHSKCVWSRLQKHPPHAKIYNLSTDSTLLPPLSAALNKWCKILTIKILMEVYITKRKSIYSVNMKSFWRINELMKKFASLLTDFCPPMDFHNFILAFTFTWNPMFWRHVDLTDSYYWSNALSAKSVHWVGLLALCMPHEDSSLIENCVYYSIPIHERF